MKSGKRKSVERRELPNQECMTMFGKKENYKYLGILVADIIKQVEMKGEKKKKENLWRMRKLLKTKPCSRNLIKGINIWAVSFVKYLGSFLKWTREELGQMDQRTRKSMPMPKA